VWEHNNLAQKNLSVVDLHPNDWIVVPVVVKNSRSLTTRNFLLEIVRPKDRLNLQASLIHSSGQAFKPPENSTLRKVSLPLMARPEEKAEALDCGGRDVQGMAEFNEVLTSRSAGALRERSFANAVELPFNSGRTARLAISLRPEQQIVFGFRLDVPGDARPGEVIRTDIIQRDAGGKQILGGVAVEIHVR